MHTTGPASDRAAGIDVNVPRTRESISALENATEDALRAVIGPAEAAYLLALSSSVPRPLPPEPEALTATERTALLAETPEGRRELAKLTWRTV